MTAASVLIAVTVLPGCQSRGAIPPNGLTAILRSIPIAAAPGPIHLRSGDPSEARRLSGGSAPPETIPKIAKQRVADGWIPEQIEAWLEVTPSGTAPFVVLIGDFDSKSVKSSLESRDYQSTKVELTEIFNRSDTTAAIGVAPGRLVYGSLETVERIGAFRGGNGSLLDVAGLRDVAVATGRSGVAAVFEPASGCPRASWIAAASRFENAVADTSLVWYYPDAEAATRAARELRTQLPSRLPSGVTLRLSDPRNRQAVQVLETPREKADAVIEITRPGGPFEGLPECPK
ncbi:MAG: hypothetical protein DCC49_04550 [Acidobacteria bacterium]|nr:MAG: hypothetical protein DCC49_04550 [Acidobacteriota bacterium]